MDTTGKLARWRLPLIKYEFDIVHWARVEPQPAGALSRPPTEGTDDLDINDVISIMAVVTRTQKRLTKVQYNTSKQSHNETNEPQLPVLVEFMSTHGTDAYRDSIRPSAGILESCSNCKMNGLSVRHSPIGSSMNKFGL